LVADRVQHGGVRSRPPDDTSHRNLDQSCGDQEGNESRHSKRPPGPWSSDGAGVIRAHEREGPSISCTNYAGRNNRHARGANSSSPAPYPGWIDVSANGPPIERYVTNRTPSRMRHHQVAK